MLGVDGKTVVIIGKAVRLRGNGYSLPNALLARMDYRSTIFWGGDSGTRNRNSINDSEATSWRHVAR